MDDVLHAVDLDRRPVGLHGADLAPAVAGSSFWYDGFGWPSGVPPYPPRSHCDPQVNRELAVIPVSTWITFPASDTGKSASFNTTCRRGPPWRAERWTARRPTRLEVQEVQKVQEGPLPSFVTPLLHLLHFLHPPAGALG
jgi:hypothetical protein